MKLQWFICLYVCVNIGQAYLYQSGNFTTSLNAWQTLKPSCYIYTVVNINDNDGQTVSRTTITVRNDTVTSRSYRKTDLFHYPDQFLDSWEENNSSNIGSHGGQFGTDIFPAVTLDHSYTYCKDNILTQDRDIENGEDFNSAAFETFKNGVMAYCAFYNGLCLGFCGDIINVDSFRTC